MERTEEIDFHYSRFESGLEPYEMNIELIQQIIRKIYSLGYVESYFESDVGLIWSADNELIEN